MGWGRVNCWTIKNRWDQIFDQLYFIKQAWLWTVGIGLKKSIYNLSFYLFIILNKIILSFPFIFCYILDYTIISSMVFINNYKINQFEAALNNTIQICSVFHYTLLIFIYRWILMPSENMLIICEHQWNYIKINLSILQCNSFQNSWFNQEISNNKVLISSCV